jgi:hypothetical protein
MATDWVGRCGAQGRRRRLSRGVRVARSNEVHGGRARRNSEHVPAAPDARARPSKPPSASGSRSPIRGQRSSARRTTTTQRSSRPRVPELFAATPKTIGRWADEGRLPSFRTIGGQRRFLWKRFGACLLAADEIPAASVPGVAVVRAGQGSRSARGSNAGRAREDGVVVGRTTRRRRHSRPRRSRRRRRRKRSLVVGGGAAAVVDVRLPR